MPKTWKTKNPRCPNNVISTVASINAAPINSEGKPSWRKLYDSEKMADRLRIYEIVMMGHTAKTVITHLCRQNQTLRKLY